jgi:hypothetical protein
MKKMRDFGREKWEGKVSVLCCRGVHCLFQHFLRDLKRETKIHTCTNQVILAQIEPCQPWHVSHFRGYIFGKEITRHGYTFQCLDHHQFRWNRTCKIVEILVSKNEQLNKKTLAQNQNCHTTSRRRRFVVVLDFVYLS